MEAVLAEAANRRSQKDRSADTSARLMRATIDLMHDQGLARLSTTDIARTAGVSRGALTHHYASREAIIRAAVADMLGAATRDLHRFAKAFVERGGSSDEIVDYIWQMMSDRLFYVTMEFLPEARHNTGFRADLIPIVRGFHAALDAVWGALAVRTGVAADQVRVVMNATMCLVRGMIAQTVLREDAQYYTDMLGFWKAQIRRQFPSFADPLSGHGVTP